MSKHCSFTLLVSSLILNNKLKLKFLDSRSQKKCECGIYSTQYVFMSWQNFLWDYYFYFTLSFLEMKKTFSNDFSSSIQFKTKLLSSNKYWLAKWHTKNGWTKKRQHCGTLIMKIKSEVQKRRQSFNRFFLLNFLIQIFLFCLV